MKFAHPWWLGLGGVVLILLLGYIFVSARKKRHLLRFSSYELLEKVAPTRPGPLRHLPTAFMLIGMCLLTVAVASPTEEVKVPRNRATVMLAIDVSLSMESTDVAPNRITAAQEAATQFAQDLTPDVNLGIIAFAGVATVLLSPTTDRAQAEQAIADLKLDQRTATGEAIISGLQAIDVFTKTISGAEGPPPARIVLMSDGKQTTGRDVFEAAQRAADQSVPISTIAFGTQGGSVSIEGKDQPVPVDEESMREIARISNGDFHSAASAAELKTVYSQLGEQIGFELKEQDNSRPWLIAGTLAVLLAGAASLVITQRIP
ncbi:VWA domain-containing protein [Nakamurella antarctica]|uniref:VWA domain-containing protein n=1 Tax=Nakamurella antarctica TaxID=1902245 RepID=A0A3G8ZL41_9ACTN|nr:VWA domain-containing protein [Nakamurella antarctica]AZI58042.1 VWA domain-containing protein [Nakamurella antarctica]